MQHQCGVVESILHWCRLACKLGAVNEKCLLGGAVRQGGVEAAGSLEADAGSLEAAVSLGAAVKEKCLQGCHSACGLGAVKKKYLLGGAVRQGGVEAARSLEAKARSLEADARSLEADAGSLEAAAVSLDLLPHTPNHWGDVKTSYAPNHVRVPKAEAESLGDVKTSHAE
ncbi:hypothetical protein ACE6H2_021949 [Prunus campanulata]